MLTETIFSSGSKVKSQRFPPSPPLHGPQELPYLKKPSEDLRVKHHAPYSSCLTDSRELEQRLTRVQISGFIPIVIPVLLGNRNAVNGKINVLINSVAVMSLLPTVS